MDCYALLQVIFLTQGSNPHLLHLPHWHEGSLPLGKPTNMSVCVCVCVCVCTHILRKDLHIWLEFSFLLYNMLRTVIIFTVLCKNIVFHQLISENYGLRNVWMLRGEKKRKDLNIMQPCFPIPYFYSFFQLSPFPWILPLLPLKELTT